MNKYKTIGIIGGQGLSSTADFYMRIAKYYQENLNARYVRDFPPMVIFSVPGPDLVQGNDNEQMTFDLIAEAVKKLERDGCDFIVIVCNSLQYLIGRLQVLVKIPIIGVAPITARCLKDKGYKTVGILATDTTIKNDAFKAPLQELGIELVAPNEADQKIVESIILNEIGGVATDKDRDNLKSAVGNLRQKGAQAVLLACTELPLLINQRDTDVPLVDCNDLYAIETAKLSSQI